MQLLAKNLYRVLSICACWVKGTHNSPYSSGGVGQVSTFFVLVRCSTIGVWTHIGNTLHPLSRSLVHFCRAMPSIKNDKTSLTYIRTSPSCGKRDQDEAQVRKRNKSNLRWLLAVGPKLSKKKHKLYMNCQKRKIENKTTL